MKEYKLLLIDDDHFMREFLASFLTEKFEISVLDDANKALKELEDINPDLIIIDLNMPKMDGYTFIQLIKANSELAHFPVMVLSSSEQSSDRIKCLKAGAEDFLLKPFNPEELEIKISKIIEKNNDQNSGNQQKPKTVKKKKSSWIKRAFDIGISFGLLLVLSPILILVAILIRIESPGSVFYTSKRIGSDYKIFDFYKFRSMSNNADAKLSQLSHLNQYANEGVDEDLAEEPVMEDICEDCKLSNGGVCKNEVVKDGQVFCEKVHLHLKKMDEGSAFVKISNDPRVTKIGKFIRNTSIDELPQLFNVLKGDMSLVGNRPLPLYEAEKLTQDEYVKRFRAPAGITGLWQVTKRGKKDMSEEERKELDIEYAKNQSLWLDMKILLMTFPALLQKDDV
ncbi:sugar transferase [Sediminitomix flava]|uniref:Lipopolysaccharide/colanic/teichoic acid biosynthesis glycosyltransferase n=1 Tax=Sediminitomix flava TaxID=379075 RepID=A0A315Z6W9_SEDFL|nr:sugar transferase [Sediminitomix flava]PWJ38505.1 lipopolysaccharide/colanic/teichoic acid biosynthesis glycosyltransferase [Sediminitomix flava]